MREDQKLFTRIEAKAIDLFATGWGYTRAQAETFWPRQHQYVQDYFLKRAADAEPPGFSLEEIEQAREFIEKTSGGARER